MMSNLIQKRHAAWRNSTLGQDLANIPIKVKEFYDHTISHGLSKEVDQFMLSFDAILSYKMVAYNIDGKTCCSTRKTRYI